MKVIFNKTYAHGSRRFAPGAVVDLPDREARGIIQRGYAKLVLPDTTSAEVSTRSLEQPPVNKMVTDTFKFLHKKAKRGRKR